MLTLVKLMRSGNYSVLFFQSIISNCTTTVPNLVLLAYPYPEIRAGDKNDPHPQTCTDSNSHRSSRVKNYRIFKENTQNKNILFLINDLFFVLFLLNIFRIKRLEMEKLLTSIVQVQMLSTSCNSQFTMSNQNSFLCFVNFSDCNLSIKRESIIHGKQL